MAKLIIAGAGGLGSEAAWVAEEMNLFAKKNEAWEILGYIDDDVSKAGKELYGYRILGEPEQVAEGLMGERIHYCCAIGDNQRRKAMAARLDYLNWRPIQLIHPSVARAKDCIIGQDVYIGALSVLSPGCQIGSHVLINQRVAIGHDAILADYCQVSPGGQINGFCQLAEGVLVGSNASIYQGKKVGAWATVGSNSLVVTTVAAGNSVLGVPARRIDRLIHSHVRGKS